MLGGGPRVATSSFGVGALTQRDIVACCLGFGCWQILSLGLVSRRLERSRGWGDRMVWEDSRAIVWAEFSEVYCARVVYHNAPARLFS